MRKLFPFNITLHLALVVSAAALFLAQLSIPVAAQNLASSAAISGFVADPQGNRVANAQVTLSNSERAITRGFKTDESGKFTFSLLPAATYKLSVSAPGFATRVDSGIVLEVGQSVQLNVALSVGAATEQVSVTGEEPVLTTDNANIGSQVSSKQMVEMPLNFRSAAALMFLNASARWLSQSATGGTEDTADQDQSLMNFGGQFFGTAAFLLDGSWNSAMGWSGIIYSPSVDTVQEFKIQTNSFTAQYGLSDGNVVNVVSKSGTDQFHGDVFEFLRNYATDANTYLNNAAGRPRASTRMNQFGATAGGPVFIPGIYKQRQRTFFFGGYEGLRLGAPSSILTTVPTSAFKSGDMSSLLGATAIGTDALGKPIYPGQLYNPFSTRQIGVDSGGKPIYYRDPIPNNNIASVPGLMDSVATKVASYFPGATNSSLPGQGNNYYQDLSSPTVSNELNVRIDHAVSDKARLYGRFSRKWEYKVNSGALYGASNPSGPGQTNPNNRYSGVFGYSQVLSPSLVASANVGLNRWVEANVSQNYGFHPSTLGLPAQLDANSPMFPRVNIDGFAQLGSGNQMASANNEASASADIVKTLHVHTFSFGYNYILSQLNGGAQAQSTFSFTSAFTSGPDPQHPQAVGNAFASFLVGTASSGSAPQTLLPSNGKVYHGVYFQDDWKMTSKLTLNLGLRYDIQLAPTERHNWQSYFEPNQVNPISQLVGGNYKGQIVFNGPNNKYLYNNSYKNISPRIGFSEMLTKNLVARGGFAIFFPTQFLGNPPTIGYSQTTSYVSSLNGGLNPSSTFSNPFPQGFLSPIGNSRGGLTNVGQNISSTILHNRPSSYVEQWMFGFQYSPSSRDVFEASYIGNHGLHMVMSSLNLNQLPPQYLAQGSAALTAATANPFFGQAAVASSGCGLANATIPAYQLLLPMPQYCSSVTGIKPNVGFSNYNALDVKYSHRMSDNLTIVASYDHSKFLDDTIGSSSFVLFFPSVVRNNYNLAAEKSVDYSDTPNAAVVSYIYTLPFGRGQKWGSDFNRAADVVLGHWQVSGISTFRAGTPMAINGNLNAASVYGGGQHANVVGNPNVAGTVSANPGCSAPSKVKSVDHWFNPCAFTAAAPGTFGNAPRYFSNLRAPGYQNWDLSVSKWFTTKERIRTQFRAEVYNLANHVNWATIGTETVGTANMGSLNYTGAPREMQFALKIYW